MWGWDSNAAFENFIHANASPPLDLLLGPLLMLFAHVHDRGGRGTVKFVTVHALELFLDLVGHPTVLARALMSWNRAD